MCITLRDHIGRFEPDPARRDGDTGAALAGLTAVADKLAGVRACTARAGPDVVETLVRHRIDARAERHLAAADLWSALAELAPALGMVGTLVGRLALSPAVGSAASDAGVASEGSARDLASARRGDRSART